ncbi:hypothetical protein [Thalassorhabdomicrobium marinisediminis]|uniref:Uncharacterized protein n=1 Tax=Thalassorhabdomicrobium marinisediminis TaxID=2170577 RepID=A0A2T7FXZ0_9RHOB|nr:hypothetical protein [Thalassorhabdomicrobium marinisediminis]PVA07033.1 hypothetical protein DC363_07800 [Thalassorhabdomicrobium marinisediminis]
MRQSLRRDREFSEGERARALAFLVVGISSAGLGFLAVLRLEGASVFDGISAYQLWIIAASALGGLAALFLSGDRMGQAGVAGALRGVAGAIWVTFIGAVIGGTLSLPLYGTMFGPFIVCVTLLGAPLLALLWATNLIAVHILMGVYQRERDSIFAVADSKAVDPNDSLTARLRGRLV